MRHSRRSRLAFQYLHERVQWRFLPERRLAGEHLVQDRAQAVDVAARADNCMMPGGLLGRHVAGRADNHAAARDVAVRLEQLHQPKVGDIGIALGVQEDVGRLEIAMHNSARV